MKLKFSIFCILGIIFINKPAYSQVDLTVFLSHETEVFYKKSKIPLDMKNELNNELKNQNERFRIANPIRSYRATDIISNRLLPRRQLIFLLNCDDFWLLSYYLGGRGQSQKFIYKEISSANNNKSKLILMRKVENYQHFLELIKAGENFQVFDIPCKYYL